MQYRDPVSTVFNSCSLIMQCTLVWIFIVLSIVTVTQGQGRNVLLAIVGIPIGNDVETVHLDNTSLKCEKPPAFPHDVYGPIGAYINGEAIVCGGFDDSDYDTSEKCFSLDVIGSNQTWLQKVNMTEKRLRAMSVLLDEETWFITGGTFGDERLDTTEIYQDGAFRQGPRLPSKLYNHCMVQINGTTTFVAGGLNGDSIRQDKAYAYRWDLDMWIELMPMFQAKEGMACALVDRPGDPEIIVAGGGSGLDVDSVEILNLENGLWRIGPTLPETMVDASFVSTGEKIVLAGGYSTSANSWLSTLYEFDVMGNSWVKMEQEMAIGRSRFVALTVEEESANCST